MNSRYVLVVTGSTIALAFAQQTHAQSTQNQPAPPTNYNIDQNGVDVVTGAFYLRTVDVAVGSGNGGLQYKRYSRNLGYDDDYTTALNNSGSAITVSLGSISDKFTNGGPGSTVQSNLGTGAKLLIATTGYTYTTSNGIIYQFSFVPKSQRFRLAAQRVTSIVWPDGRTVTIEYQSQTIDLCNRVCTSTSVSRPAAVESNDGYRLTFTYKLTSLPTTGPVTDQQGADWMTVANVVGSNAGVMYCSAENCPAGGTWPSIRYSWNVAGTEETRTDGMNRITVIGYDASNRIVSVRYGTSSTALRTLAYDTSGRVYQFTIGTSTWTYTYSDSGTTRTTTVTAPTGPARTVVSDLSALNITSNKTGTNQPITYQYDGNTRLEWVNYPEGNKVKYTYDGTRGNIIATTNYPKSGVGTIITSAEFPTDDECSSLPIAKCNLPKSTTDARGQITNYEYTDFGAPARVTLPAPTVGSTRPQTRYGYSYLQAWYKKSASGPIEAGTPTWKVTTISSCSVGAETTGPDNCVNKDKETRSVFYWGDGSTTVPNNLLLRVQAQQSGNFPATGSVYTNVGYSYTPAGDVSEIKGPVSADDVTYRRYNANRELEGEISPRPVATSSTRRATRISRNATSGLVEKVEAGTTTTTDLDTFVPSQRIESTYDPVTYLKTVDRIYADLTLYQLTQYGYDAALRPRCTATRIGLVTNPEVCQQLSNAEGYDQVVETVYDANTGRVSKQRVNAIDTSTFDYTANSNISTITDANGNVSTYGYDLYDRRNKVTYPGGSYEELTYDAADNVTLERRRNATTITNANDFLNRRTSRTPSSSANTAPIAYEYDNFGRMIRANGTGTGNWSNDHVFTYDALSRLTSQTTKRPGNPDHTLSMLYDAAGRRTRLTWWGTPSFYVDYAYLGTGEVDMIKENGGFALANYDYDDLGRRVKLTRGNGTVTEWEPDGISRLKKLTDSLGTFAANQQVTFSYNAVSQLRTRQGNNDAYSYASYAPASASYVSNPLNQIASISATTLAYDTRGNLTADNRGNAYTYNIDNQLVGKTSIASLAYDPMGRLASLAPSGTTIRFDYDDADMIAESDASGNLLRRYVHGAGIDEPLVWYDSADLTKRRWIGSDERGSVTAVTTDIKSVVGINRYDEFGVPSSRNVSRFGYSGQAWLREIGLAYYKARMYDPVLGRFLQTDPVGYASGMNLYTYVQGDPVNLVDPSGMGPQTDCSRGACSGPGGGSDSENGGSDIIVNGQRQSSGLITGSAPAGGNSRRGWNSRPTGNRPPQNNNQCPSVPARRDIGSTGLAGAAARDPTGIIIAGEVRGLANEASRAQFPNLSSSGTARDAFRHFYGAFALTRLIGPTRALNILNAVEVSGGNSAADRNMDTFNNHVAIQMAQDPRNQGRATADLANAALAQGCLTVNR